jgi:hypothetical protein
MYTEKQKEVWRHVHSRCGFDIWMIIQNIDKIESSSLIDEMKKLSKEYLKKITKDEEFYSEYKEDRRRYNKIILDEFIENYNDKFNKE